MSTSMNRLDKTTRTHMNIISSYVVDLFYNQIYISAKNEKDKGNYSSITAGYKNIMLIFSQCIDSTKPKYKKVRYNAVVNGIRNYFELYTNRDVASMPKFIDYIVNTFVPKDFRSGLSHVERRKILRKIIVTPITTFVKEICKNYMQEIIDNRSEESVLILTNAMIYILNDIRDEIYMSFSSTAGHVNTSSKLITQLREKNHHMSSHINDIKIRNEELANSLTKSYAAFKFRGKIIDNYKLEIIRLRRIVSQMFKKSSTNLNQVNNSSESLGLTNIQKVDELSTLNNELEPNVLPNMNEKLDTAESSEMSDLDAPVELQTMPDLDEPLEVNEELNESEGELIEETDRDINSHDAFKNSEMLESKESEKKIQTEIFDDSPVSKLLNDINTDSDKF